MPNLYNERKPFDLLNSPLEGTNLIEASAGTGKTFTLAGLFIRLLLEKKFKINEILTVTFTEAATRELRTRVRETLKQAILVFSGQISAPDDQSSFLFELRNKSNSIQEDHTLLMKAFHGFDEVSIFTIHGFCKRMLYENAFESSVSFDIELVQNQTELLNEIIHDFWRLHFYDESFFFIEYVFNQKVTTDSLLKLLQNCIGKPYLDIVPNEISPEMNLTQVEHDYFDMFVKAREVWEPKNIYILLFNHKGLNWSSYPRKKLLEWVKDINKLMASEKGHIIFPDCIKKFCSSTLSESIRPGTEPPSHPFFDAIEKLYDQANHLKQKYHDKLIALKIKLIQESSPKLSRIKQTRNIQSFDDLLLNLDHGLLGEKGDKLAKAIRSKYKAALIDEFQDTDPVQYNIFQTLFRHPDSLFFMIGDPKQSIYSFRGADIFAYLMASKQSENTYTLLTNYRSGHSLVQAINALFSKAKQPFGFKDISFDPAVADKTIYLSLNGEARPGLHIQFFQRGLDRIIYKNKGEKNIIKWLMESIYYLLSNDFRLMPENKPVTPGDIAILVRKNSQAQEIKHALQKYQIPGILSHQESIFQSHEISEIYLVISAIVSYEKETRIKAALTTDMMGYTCDDLIQLQADENQWEECILSFRMYHRMWLQNNFIRMFMFFLQKQKVRPRILSFPDGERRLTNIMQCAELLYQETLNKNLTMNDLLNWINRKRFDSKEISEELRLETDENAVQIATLHKSKGLQYPIVFCPFLWESSTLRENINYTYHNPDLDNKQMFVIDDKHGESTKQFAENELLAENLRLLYVGLTRAQYLCYLVWGQFNYAASSPIAWVLHQPPMWNETSMVNSLSAHVSRLSDNQMIRDIQDIIDRSQGNISLKQSVIDPYAGNDAPYNYKPIELYQFSSISLKEGLTYVSFLSHINREWRISSFSSLTSEHDHRMSDHPDHDELAPVKTLTYESQIMIEEDEEEDLSLFKHVFSFPKGARAGTFFHDIFEHLDFTLTQPSQRIPLIKEKLDMYGYSNDWIPAINTMIQHTLTMPLIKNTPHLSLSSIAMSDRLNELSFYFPIQSLTPKTLLSCFKTSDRYADYCDQLYKLSFRTLKGMMKGFIDCVIKMNGQYYIIDWKSNWLGNSYHEYHWSNLSKVMTHEYYFLQYTIYTLAVHKYLSIRIPDYDYTKDFGGILYLFIRGIHAEKGPEYGIFQDRLDEQLVHDFHRLISPQNCNQ